MPLHDGGLSGGTEVRRTEDATLKRAATKPGHRVDATLPLSTRPQKIPAVSLQRPAYAKHQLSGGPHDITFRKMRAPELYVPCHRRKILQRPMRNDGRHRRHRVRLPASRMRRPQRSQLERRGL